MQSRTDSWWWQPAVFVSILWKCVRSVCNNRFRLDRKCSNLENNRSCQVWPSTFHFNLSLPPTFLSCPCLLIQMCFLYEHWGPLASMTNSRGPYVKLHVCLILNQTHKKKGLGLVKTSGSLGTPGFAPLLLSDCERKSPCCMCFKVCQHLLQAAFLLLKSWLTHRDARKIVNTSHLPAHPLSCALVLWSNCFLIVSKNAHQYHIFTNT